MDQQLWSGDLSALSIQCEYIFALLLSHLICLETVNLFQT